MILCCISFNKYFVYVILCFGSVLYIGIWMNWMCIVIKDYGLFKKLNYCNIFYLVIFNKYVYCLMYSSFGIKNFLGIFGV